MTKEKAQLAMPYIKLYPQDILAHAAREMTLPAFGAYMILLLFAWNSDPPATIPADEKAIRRIVGADPDEWQAIREQVLSKFEPWEDDASSMRSECVENGKRLVNQRLRKEWLGATEGFEERSKRGKAGAAKRWGNRNGEEPEAGGFSFEEDLDA